MAVTSKMYGQVIIKALSKEINVTSDTLKVMLCSSDYVPNQDTHVYKSDIFGEVSGPGYVSGGLPLTGLSMVYNSGDNTVTIDANDIVWPTSTITARYAVIYDNSPATDAQRPLLGYVDFGQDYTSSNGNFAVQWDSSGIFIANTP